MTDYLNFNIDGLFYLIIDGLFEFPVWKGGDNETDTLFADLLHGAESFLKSYN